VQGAPYRPPKRAVVVDNERIRLWRIVVERGEHRARLRHVRVAAQDVLLDRPIGVDWRRGARLKRSQNSRLRRPDSSGSGSTTFPRGDPLGDEAPYHVGIAGRLGEGLRAARDKAHQSGRRVPENVGP
jgi:hypothetical protein